MEKRELPEGWEWKRLGDVCTKPEYGYTTSAKIDGSGPKFLRTTDITKSTFDWDSVPFCEQIPDDEEKYQLRDGDILISRAGSVGASFVVKNPPRAVFASYLIRFQPKKELDPNFADFFLKSNLFKNQLGGSTTGTTLQGVNAQNLAKIKIPLPPPNVQRQIVAVLEQADALTGALLQSVFYEMFGDPVRNERGWEVLALEELSSHIIDCPHSTPEYEDGITPFPCIRTTELKDGYIDWTQMKYLNEKNYFERINRLTPNEGDIVFGREGSFGVAVRVPKNVKLCLGQRVMLFRPDPKYCNSEFLWALLNSDAILRQANSKTSGSTVAHINVTDIKKFGGICPPLALQQQFARIVEEMERVRERQAESGRQIEALCGGLMARAFGGELIA